MKKKFTQIKAVILLILINIMILNIFPLVSAYPDEGDCKDYHTVINIIPYYEKEASIQLDGIPSENFWTHHTNENQNGTLTIPLASEGGMPLVVVYLNITFVLTEDYLYILCKWLDNSTRPNLGSNIYDGLYFCWNINVPNFSAYFPSGMSTLEMGGGDVDSWDWSCLSTSPPNGSSYYCRDRCFGTYGWYTPDLETEDVEVGYTYRTNISYTLEIKRKLITNDQYDVQFDQYKIYKFNMGIMDNGNHEDHLISWTHALDLRPFEQPESVNGYLVIIIITFLAISVLIFNKMSKVQLEVK